ncbi:hypothetical protein ATE47_00540 [Chryseobacterium sp. IHB B 17019]|jgi:hypothetical protein|uniref:hypothetical protein n=1 Tax=Chryseobacterium sp. IHB B 17019 TaxID=1721091 RepID=UPI00071EE66C|nr:hypothetical protein [Chryseobacterium sp. IHB B 17019]ALR29125.1 hypothetical protein ATE47_00540 [Chryseobacterium sp. IHB B 17019]
MKKKVLFSCLLLIGIKTFSQTGINTPNPQAALDIVSDKSGILIPRMTASQIEQITSATEGELVFSTTNTGTTVNLIGFWFYDGTTWRPVVATSSGGVNIYNSDGTLAGNRIVGLDNHNLNIGPDKVLISGDPTGNIGVMTSTPTQKLDVNGGMRVRSLSQGNVFTTTDGTLTTDASSVYRYGDMRYSSLTTDHGGWYLLNGRTLTTLPANVQSRAASLGITGTLPNAANKYMKQGTPGATTGAGSVVLTQANMPAFTLSGNTSSVNHNHALVSPGFTVLRATDIVQDPAGTANSDQLAGGAAVGSISASQTYTSNADGAHAHTVTIPTGGTATAIPLAPNYIQVNYFIYLGT